MPWHTHDLGDLLNARNTTTGKPYAESNTFSVALEALDRGLPTGEWFTAIGADLHYGSDRAYYNPKTDRIYDPAPFAATNLHDPLSALVE